MNKLNAVFWDVDGTIADTEMCGHRVAFNLAFKDFDLDWYWDETKYIQLLKISGGLNRIINYRAESKTDISEEKCSEIQCRKRIHYKKLVQSGKIKVRNGVLRLIDELSKNDVQQFIVTTSGRDSLDPFLKNSLSTHLENFSGIITYEDVARHKPYADAYNLALKLSKATPLNSIAIEDSEIGVKAAKNANLNCLLTLPPWSSSHKNITKKANACFDGLGDQSNLPKLIYGLPLINNYIDFEYLTKIIN